MKGSPLVKGSPLFISEFFWSVYTQAHMYKYINIGSVAYMSIYMFFTIMQPYCDVENNICTFTLTSANICFYICETIGIYIYIYNILTPGQNKHITLSIEISSKYKVTNIPACASCAGIFIITDKHSHAPIFLLNLWFVFCTCMAWCRHVSPNIPWSHNGLLPAVPRVSQETNSDVVPVQHFGLRFASKSKFCKCPVFKKNKPLVKGCTGFPC